MNYNDDEWLTLREVAAMMTPPLTSEAIRIRLSKPNAPQHQKVFGRWLVSKNSLVESGWLDLPCAAG